MSKKVENGIPIMSEHTPEPWAHSGHCWIDDCVHLGTVGSGKETGIELPDGKCIAIRTADALGDNEEGARANARRIVACINACEDISTKTLESVKLADVGYMHDALLDCVRALETAQPYVESSGWTRHRDDEIAQIEEAITNARKALGGGR